MSTRARIGLIGGVVAVAVVLFVVLNSGGGGSDTTEPGGKPPVIRVEGAKPVGGIQDVSVDQPNPIRFKVISDTAGDAHLHGYEIEKPVKKGGSVAFDVPSKLEGQFELELHIGGSETNAVQIAEVRVNPS